MYFLKYFNFKTIKYDLLNKFYYSKTKDLPKIKKIILNFGCKTTQIKNISASLLALELLTSKTGNLTATKHSDIFLKIRKGNPVGCKVILKNTRMFNFLQRIICEVFPKMKNVNQLTMSKKVKKNVFSYKMYDIFSFSELEKNYYFFNELNKLDITFVIDSKFEKETYFILASFHLPYDGTPCKYNSIERV